MNSYVIRAVSWAYNDQSYDYDGVNQIVKVFSDYESAQAERQKMERECLLMDFDGIFRFEVGEDNYEAQMERRQRIMRFLYDRFGFNPTILISPVNLSVSLFDTKPSDALLDELVDVIGAYQYKVVVYPEGNSFEVYTAQLNKDICGSHDDGKLYFDNSDKERFFLSRQEAVDQMLDSIEFKYVKTYFNKRAYFNRPLSELSLFPQMLEDLVSDSLWLDYKDGRLYIDYHTDKETLHELFALLKDDFLILKKRSLEDEDMKKDNPRYREREVEKIWAQIAERNAKYGSLDGYLKSQERLDIHKSTFWLYPVENKHDPYGEVLKNYLLETFGEDEVKFTGQFSKIKKKSFQFDLVISEYNEENNRLNVHLKTNYDHHFDIERQGIGQSIDVRSSLLEGLVNWLDSNGHYLEKRILEINVLDIRAVR